MCPYIAELKAGEQINNTFNFYEIVKLQAVEQEFLEIHNMYGTVVGMSENSDGAWGYAVDFNGEAWDVDENKLSTTGRFSTRESIYTDEQIKVMVDSSSQEGKLE